MGTNSCKGVCPPNPEIRKQQYFEGQVKSQSQPKPPNHYKIDPIPFDDADQPQSSKGQKILANQQQNSLPIGMSPQISKQISKDSDKQNIIVVKWLEGDEPQIAGVADYQPINVPFSVIRISMSEQIQQKIYNADNSFFQKHMNKSKPQSSKWILLQQGIYANLYKNNFGVFISSKQFYQGYFMIDPDSKLYMPHGNGLYINDKIIYQGNLSEGRAHNRGKCTINNTIYEGEWEYGKLQRGVIQNSEFVYNGDLDGKVPHGKGKLQYKSKKCQYEGMFKDGKFDGKQGSYECESYSYKGGFKDGKKHGIGTLVQKQQIMRQRKKYHPALKIVGQWVQDTFVDKINILQFR